MSALDRIFDGRPVRSSTAFRWLWIGTTTSAFALGLVGYAREGSPGGYQHRFLRWRC